MPNYASRDNYASGTGDAPMREVLPHSLWFSFQAHWREGEAGLKPHVWEPDTDFIYMGVNPELLRFFFIHVSWSDSHVLL